MAKITIMPKIGISIESCVITEWHKNVGDSVTLGENLFSFETDKSTMDQEAEVSGVLREIFFEAGEEVPVLLPCCIVSDEGEDISALLAEAKAALAESGVQAEPELVEQPTAVQQTQKAAAPTSNALADVEKVSPRAKSVAQKLGVPLEAVAPTGPYGRIIERDVRNCDVRMTSAAYALTGGTAIGGRIGVSDVANAASPASSSAASVASAQKPAPVKIPAPDKKIVGEYTDQKMTKIRSTIAAAMKHSLTSTAQLTNNSSFDATSLMATAKAFKQPGAVPEGDKITINDIMLFCVSRVLKDFPDANCHLLEDGSVRHFDDVHLGIACATDRGLMVPKIMFANKKSLLEISRESKSLVEQCKKGSISPDLLSNGTFTTTNLGSLGIESFTPILNPPEVAILGINAIVTRPRIKDGEVEFYPSMTLSVTYDHRILDGAPAAQLAIALKNMLENVSQESLV